MSRIAFVVIPLKNRARKCEPNLNELAVLIAKDLSTSMYYPEHAQ